MGGSNRADPNQTPYNVASDQGLHSLLTGFSIKNNIKAKNRPDTPKMKNGLVQNIRVEGGRVYQFTMCQRKGFAPLEAKTFL